MQNIDNARVRIPFGRLARQYLDSLDIYHDAKTAVKVAWHLGNEDRDVRYHAAQCQALHLAARDELLAAALLLDEKLKREAAEARATA